MVLRFDMVYDGLICFMMVWYNYINVLLEPWRQHTPVDGVYVEYIYIYDDNQSYRYEIREMW